MGSSSFGPRGLPFCDRRLFAPHQRFGLKAVVGDLLSLLIDNK
jgi:hypothetical protein